MRSEELFSSLLILAYIRAAHHSSKKELEVKSGKSLSEIICYRIPIQYTKSDLKEDKSVKMMASVIMTFLLIIVLVFIVLIIVLGGSNPEDANGNGRESVLMKKTG